MRSQVSVYLQNWSHVLSYVNKAESTPEIAEVSTVYILQHLFYFIYCVQPFMKSNKIFIVNFFFLLSSPPKSKEESEIVKIKLSSPN